MAGHRFGWGHIIDEAAVACVEGEDCGAALRKRAAGIGAQTVLTDLHVTHDQTEAITAEGHDAPSASVAPKPVNTARREKS
jgi:hypothetical protein